MTKQQIYEIALTQSAVDCACVPEDFTAPDNRLFVSRANPDARRYLELPHILNLVSYGTNVVATGREELLPEVRAYLDSLEAVYRAFETPALYRLNALLVPHDAAVCFMAHYFLPDPDAVNSFESRCPYELNVLYPADFAGLYLPEWSNALCEKRANLDVLAVGAYDGGRLVGMAGCSADCDSMRQIGVDVLPEYRRQGIASAVTNTLAKIVLDDGLVPFYCAAWSNVKSSRTAIRAGFRPAWVEATAKSRAFIRGMEEKS